VFKKIFALVILTALCLSFAGCGTKGAPDVKAPQQEMADIQDYTGGNTVYFMPSMEYARAIIEAKGLSGDEAFNEFVNTWGEYATLPEALVKSYTDNLKASNDGMTEEKAKELAVQLIKEEMVVATAFKVLCPKAEITAEMRSDAAVDMGIADESADKDFGTDTYAVDAFIKHQVVAAYLNGEDACYGISFTGEESSEEVSE